MQTDHVRLLVPANHNNKIIAIKAIRTLTGLGLKEAKDISDQPGEHHVQVDYRFRGPDSALFAGEFETQARALRNEGYEVGGSVFVLLQELRMMAAKALEMQEDELANEILQLVLANKLKHGV